MRRKSKPSGAGINMRPDVYVMIGIGLWLPWILMCMTWEILKKASR